MTLALDMFIQSINERPGDVSWRRRYAPVNEVHLA